MTPQQLLKQKDTLRWLLLGLKLCYSLFENTPGEIPNHRETSQSTRPANQLSGLRTIQAFAKDICKQTRMGHSKIQKKKNRKSLVGPESYSEHP